VDVEETSSDIAAQQSPNDIIANMMDDLQIAESDEDNDIETLSYNATDNVKCDTKENPLQQLCVVNMRLPLPSSPATAENSKKRSTALTSRGKVSTAAAGKWGLREVHEEIESILEESKQTTARSASITSDAEKKKWWQVGLHVCIMR
jgi:hypothetical protein